MSIPHSSPPHSFPLQLHSQLHSVNSHKTSENADTGNHRILIGCCCPDESGHVPSHFSFLPLLFLLFFSSSHRLSSNRLATTCFNVPIIPLSSLSRLLFTFSSTGTLSVALMCLPSIFTSQVPCAPLTLGLDVTMDTNGGFSIGLHLGYVVCHGEETRGSTN